MDNINIESYLFLDKENEEFVKNLIDLNRISQKLHSINDYTSLVSLTVNLLITFFNSEKGIILINDDNSDDFNIKFAINIYNEPSKLEIFKKSFLCKYIYNTNNNQIKKENAFFENNLASKDYKNINSLICGVLKEKEKVFGYIFLLNHKDSKYDEKQLFLLQEISNQISIALDNVLSYENLKKESDIRNLLQRHLPANIVSQIIQKKYNFSFQGKKDTALVMSINIHNIEELEDKLEPEDFFRLVNNMIPNITKIIFSYNGFIEKISTNQINCVFGILNDKDNFIYKGLSCALELKENIVAYNDMPISLTISSFYGEIHFGNIGFYQRSDLSISSKYLRKAELLPKIINKKGIFINKELLEEVKDKFNYISANFTYEENEIYEITEKLSSEDIIKNENAMRLSNRVSLKTLAYIVKGNNRSSGVIRDISIGGVSIGTVGDYKINDLITMTFKLPNNTSFRNIKGIIKHLEKAKFESVLSKINIIMGVEFVKLEENNSKELIDFINASMETKF
ncbi:MAG: PilZ domain-containing protein [Candidatus Sericytochromatia bacterium]